jgi:hypothetical protein
MAEWSKDHVVAIGLLNLVLDSWILVKLETRQGPSAERGERWLGRSGSGIWKAGAFKAVAPACVG